MLSFININSKEREYNAIQSGQLTEQPKALDDLGRFHLKMFRNCPIRIEIITGSHIFILAEMVKFTVLYTFKK
jgi:hypothetical protein